MIKDDNAQVHVLEVIVVAGMIFASLYFIQGLTAPTFPESYEKKPLEQRADTALSSLDNLPADKNGYRSLLSQYSEEGRNFPDLAEDFYKYLWNYTEPSFGHTLYIYNLSEMYDSSSVTADAGSVKEGIYTYQPPEVGNKVISSRLYVYNGYIYEVSMEVWYL